MAPIADRSDSPHGEVSRCTAELRRYRITGQVQGVGFRPFVYRLATELGLAGSVSNDPTGVFVEVCGHPEALEGFARRVVTDAPPLAAVESVICISSAPPPPEGNPGRPVNFRIAASDHSSGDRGRVAVDSAVCDDCLAELNDPADRRFGHALINCTNCGPRYSIVRDLPYDRSQTTMAGFEMCSKCQAEYEDPGDRRFHAQPNCCPDCGPQVILTDGAGRKVPGDVITCATAILQDGGLLCMKGLGGFHLVADATSDNAVRNLREKKNRDHKPFAIMVRNLECASNLVELSSSATELLVSSVSPIVLARRCDDRRSEKATPGILADRLADSVAMACHRFGLMLPNTPMQHLLMNRHQGPLVMTSANLSDDPLVTDDAEALERFGGFCDGFLTHDRPIQRAVDDSIVIDTPRGLVPIRRARGYVPSPLPLPIGADRPGLCAGAELKNTVTIARGGQAVLSQHIGDLTYTRAYERFEQTVDDLLRLWDIEPAWIACDMHPRYVSQRYARRVAAERGIDLVTVQHHHAHMASLMAEHQRSDPIVCIVCDGVGYGDDGTAWGGEVFVGDLTHYRRLARMRQLRLPGGDAAARQIGRCALSWLHDLYGEAAADHPVARRVMPDEVDRRNILKMLEQDISCPLSSGTGRLFDAAASVLGVCQFNHYEAMSGLTLEAAAARRPQSGAGAAEPDIITLTSVDIGDGRRLGELDHRPLLVRLLEGLERGESVEDLAFLFHDALAAALAGVGIGAAEESGIGAVGLTGGVFCNALLTTLVADRLDRAGLETLLHRQVPPNDGGVAYGQAAIAAACNRNRSAK